MKKNLRKIGFILALGAMTMTSCSEATDAANAAAETATDAAHGAADKAVDAAHGVADKVGEVAGDHKCEAGKCGDAKEAEAEHKCEAGKCGVAMEKATDAVEEAHEEHGAH